MSSQCRKEGVKIIHVKKDEQITPCGCAGCRQSSCPISVTLYCYCYCLHFPIYSNVAVTVFSLCPPLLRMFHFSQLNQQEPFLVHYTCCLSLLLYSRYIVYLMPFSFTFLYDPFASFLFVSIRTELSGSTQYISDRSARSAAISLLSH